MSGQTDSIVNLLGPLDGARFPGGCATCDAFQAVRALAAGVWVVDVFHDPDCRVLAMEAERAGRDT